MPKADEAGHHDVAIGVQFLGVKIGSRNRGKTSYAILIEDRQFFQAFGHERISARLGEDLERKAPVITCERCIGDGPDRIEQRLFPALYGVKNRVHFLHAGTHIFFDDGEDDIVLGREQAVYLPHADRGLFRQFSVASIGKSSF